MDTKSTAIYKETWKQAKKIVIVTGESLKSLIGRLVKDEYDRINKNENQSSIQD